MGPFPTDNLTTPIRRRRLPAYQPPDPDLSPAATPATRIARDQMYHSIWVFGFGEKARRLSKQTTVDDGYLASALYLRMPHGPLRFRRHSATQKVPIASSPQSRHPICRVCLAARRLQNRRPRSRLPGAVPVSTLNRSVCPTPYVRSVKPASTRSLNIGKRTRMTLAIRHVGRWHSMSPPSIHPETSSHRLLLQQVDHLRPEDESDPGGLQCRHLICRSSRQSPPV